MLAMLAGTTRAHRMLALRSLTRGSMTVAGPLVKMSRTTGKHCPLGCHGGWPRRAHMNHSERALARQGGLSARRAQAGRRMSLPHQARP